MSGLVERLRAEAALQGRTGYPRLMNLFTQAADTIEGLQRKYGDAADRQELMERWEVATKRAVAAEKRLAEVEEEHAIELDRRQRRAVTGTDYFLARIEELIARANSAEAALERVREALDIASRDWPEAMKRAEKDCPNPKEVCIECIVEAAVLNAMDAALSPPIEQGTCERCGGEMMVSPTDRCPECLGTGIQPCSDCGEEES